MEFRLELYYEASNSTDGFFTVGRLIVVGDALYSVVAMYYDSFEKENAIKFVNSFELI